jgi:hypothetical protein
MRLIDPKVQPHPLPTQKKLNKYRNIKAWTAVGKDSGVFI